MEKLRLSSSWAIVGICALIFISSIAIGYTLTAIFCLVIGLIVFPPLNQKMRKVLNIVTVYQSPLKIAFIGIITLLALIVFDGLRVSENEQIEKKEKISAEFIENKEDIILELNGLLDNEEYQKAIKLAMKYDFIDNQNITEIKNSASEALAKKERKKQSAAYLERVNREIASFKDGSPSSVPDTIDGMVIKIALFKAYGIIIEEAKKHELTTAEQKRVQTLKNNVSSTQKRVFPLMRDKYGVLTREALWANDIHVKTFGNRYATIQYSWHMLANNQNKLDLMNKVQATLELFRFKQVRMKWFKENNKYTSFKLNTPSDDVIN